MTMVVAILEKELTKVETPVKTSQLERVPPTPPPRERFPLVLIVRSAIRLYDIPAPEMLVVVLLP